MSADCEEVVVGADRLAEDAGECVGQHPHQRVAVVGRPAGRWEGARLGPAGLEGGEVAGGRGQVGDRNRRLVGQPVQHRVQGVQHGAGVVVTDAGAVVDQAQPQSVEGLDDQGERVAGASALGPDPGRLQHQAGPGAAVAGVRVVGDRHHAVVQGAARREPGPGVQVGGGAGTVRLRLGEQVLDGARPAAGVPCRGGQPDRHGRRDGPDQVGDAGEGGRAPREGDSDGDVVAAALPGGDQAPAGDQHGRRRGAVRAGEGGQGPGGGRVHVEVMLSVPLLVREQRVLGDRGQRLVPGQAPRPVRPLPAAVLGGEPARVRAEPRPRGQDVPGVSLQEFVDEHEVRPAVQHAVVVGPHQVVPLTVEVLHGQAQQRRPRQVERLGPLGAQQFFQVGLLAAGGVTAAVHDADRAPASGEDDLLRIGGQVPGEAGPQDLVAGDHPRKCALQTGYLQRPGQGENGLLDEEGVLGGGERAEKEALLHGGGGVDCGDRAVGHDRHPSNVAVIRLRSAAESPAGPVAVCGRMVSVAAARREKASARRWTVGAGMNASSKRHLTSTASGPVHITASRPNSGLAAASGRSGPQPAGRSPR